MRLDLGAAGRSAPTTIPERLTMLRKELEGVARAAGREPSEIAILGVTKTQPREAVLEAIVAGFDVVQSVDRIEAGRALAKAMRTLGKRLKVLVQVNISPAEHVGAAT